jgi:hypothetical protein
LLLSRPRGNANECVLGYLQRVSETNGFKHIGHLLHCGGLSWKNNHVPVHQILSGEFDLAPFLSLLGLSEYRSKVAPLFQTFQHVIDTPYLLVKYPKVCPECLNELGYCKHEWSLLPTVACVKHRKMLVDVSPYSGKRLSWYRQRLKQFDGDDCEIEQNIALAQSSAIQLSEYIELLLSGDNLNVTTPAILKGLSLRESLSLINFIAHYQARLLKKGFNPLSMLNSELGECYQDVWVALKNWPDSFYALLNRYRDKPMSSRGRGGINKHYRDLYEQLHHQQENRGIARIKAEFDRYIEVYWPRILVPARTTRIHFSTTARNIISKNEVAKILGSRLDRIDHLIQQGKITPITLEGSKYFFREQAETLLDEKTANWTMAEACKALRLTRYQVKLLLDADIIKTLQKPSDLNRDWVIDRAQSLKLINELSKKSRKTKPPADVVSMAGIQRQGYSIVRLIVAMLTGKLEYGINLDTDHPSSLKQFIAFKVVVSTKINRR